MPQPRSHHRYKVTKQEVGTRYQPDGTLQKVWTVHVEHPDGTTASVDMPDAYYTAHNVHDAIINQAEQVHRVANLPDSIANMPAPVEQQ